MLGSQTPIPAIGHITNKKNTLCADVFDRATSVFFVACGKKYAHVGQFGVGECNLLEVRVHLDSGTLIVSVFTKVIRPEAVESVHLLALPSPTFLPVLLNTQNSL